MKPHYVLSCFKFLSQLLLLLFITISATSCFLKQDRTTTVYGTITDQNGDPVDSILVILQGGRSLSTYETVGEVYSNQDGKYELVIDVPKKFQSAHLGVPNFPSKNQKFMKYYNGFIVQKDGKSTTCCRAGIGEKTKYDFQLIPK